jgi:hypothetical protein
MMMTLTKQVNKVINNTSSVIIVLILTLSACSLKANEPMPAILPEVSSNVTADNLLKARLEITEIVTKSLGGKKIAIAKNVFDESSRLLIGAKPVVSPSGVPLYGSSNKAPIVFELTKQAENCILQRLDTMQTWSLTTKLCIPR